jgi:hypothetical protein
MAERLFIRILVAIVLCVALLSFVLVPVPTDLPPPAFDQASLYRLEIALMFFYGILLLVTPAFSGLIRGRLPTEISTRGAKFVEEADQSAARDAAAIRELEETARDLEQRLTETDLEIRRLSESLEETVSNRR